MLRFAVYDDQGPASAWPLRRAHVLGPDGLVLSGEVSFGDGVVSADARTSGSTALATLYDAGEAGTLLLDTCLLPARESAYLLTLEIARKRIMMFLVKLEQWGLASLPADDEAMRTFESARERFTNALVMGGLNSGAYTVKQDGVAREALRLALKACDQLTARHVEIELARRVAEMRSPETALSIGCCIHPERFSDPLKRVVSETFDFIRLPMRWSEFEPEEGRYQFAATDKWIEWAVRTAQIPITGGPLLDFSPEAVPDWLYIWENDYETLRELVYEHLKRVVTRYRRTVSRWTIASGLHVNNNFTLSVEQIIDLTRLAALLVRKLHPNARLQVEIAQPFGEYAADNQRAIPPMLYAELLFQAGVSIDALAITLEMGEATPGAATRDQAQIADLLDRFAEFEKPLAISALGAPSAPPSEAAIGAEGQFDPGHWREPWSEGAQAEWLTRTIGVAFANPFVTSVCWRDLYDPSDEATNTHTGLISATGYPKAALARVREIRERLHSRKTFDGLTSGAETETASAAPRT